MSLVRMARAATFSGLVCGVAAAGLPNSAQATVQMPAGFGSLSENDVLNTSDAAGLELAQQGSTRLWIPASAADSAPPLPLAGWLLGALLIGLTAAEFRRNDATKS
ncbi:MAG: hypothetical protein AAFO72_06005 [Pseudomonadota bacterium]